MPELAVVTGLLPVTVIEADSGQGLSLSVPNLKPYVHPLAT
jgi:hypothetical protein